MTLALIVIYFLEYISFDQLMIGLVMIYAAMSAILMLYFFKLKILYLRIDLRLITKKLIKDLLTFYTYIIVVGFHRMVVSRIDVLMIPALLSTKDVGIYSVALFIGAIIDMPCRAVNQLSTPIIAQAWFDQNMKRIQDVYQKSAVNQFILGGLLFLGIWCNIDNIFRLMPKGNIYQSGKYVVLFIGLTRLIEMAAGASDVIILQSKYYRFNTILVIVLALFLFSTNLLFIPIFQITGAALATALSIFLYTLIKFIFLWITFRLQPFTKNVVWVIAAMLITWLLVGRLPMLDVALVDVIVRSTMITILFMSIVIFFKVSGDMNSFLYKTVFRYQS
jgi:O-antigen/teichoic acid export membrane protein